ncbi:hypothetical protein A3L11_06185 [Thermococcus siculi]|uniref:Uncharacterized protein n=1 Tax=Thermococcus siculi TaxID=72803 RepID=A0A2Z2MKA5_9EURY|nr:hypothetical protein [Thermococcus siculi]ASJ08832.1 hypothetical protein A3L11_06185 [Thermococcus siculi]
MGGEELRFTGNWFIDAGILGFVNLMEEVYGWDLEELQKRIKEEPEKVYYGYFPLAYFYNLSAKSDENRNTLLEAMKEVEGFKGDKHKLLELVWWRYITRLFKDKWVRSKLEKMRKRDIINNQGKIRDPYSDSKYVKLLEKREHLIKAALLMETKDPNSSENIKCEVLVKRIIGKRGELIEKKGAGDIEHKLSLEDFEKLIKNSHEKSKLWEELPKECKNKINKAIEVHYELEQYLRERWRHIASNSVLGDNTKESKKLSKFFRLPIDSSFYHNYLFFNQSKGIKEQFNAFKNILDGKVRKISKDLSKFLPSDNEFPNILYTTFDISQLQEQIPNLLAYLICVDVGMIDVNYHNAGKILFYSPDLEFCYETNRKLREWTKSLRESNNSRFIFKVTWWAIIDMMTEKKSSYSLENMYLIQLYRDEKGRIINNQAFAKVEYIGIPKLHASILLDDQIREALNTSLSVNGSNIWLLGRFLRQKPLYPLILKHVRNGIKDSGPIRWRASLYALAIDAKLRSIGRDSGLFGNFFFERPARAVAGVKEYYHDMNQNAWNVRKAIGDKNIIYPLFSAVRRHHRNAFVNILLKTLLQANNKESASRVNSYIFRRILTNDESWEDFALALVVGLAGGGADVGSSEESEE